MTPFGIGEERILMCAEPCSGKWISPILSAVKRQVVLQLMFMCGLPRGQLIAMSSNYIRVFAHTKCRNGKSVRIFKV